MFSITYIDTRQRRALIEVNSFREEFMTDSDITPKKLEEFWIEELNNIKEENTAVLPSILNGGIIGRAWVVWKDNETAYIQDMLFPEGLKLGAGSIPERVTESEDGYSISEWSTDLESIMEFLDRKGQIQTQ